MRVDLNPSEVSAGFQGFAALFAEVAKNGGGSVRQEQVGVTEEADIALAGVGQFWGCPGFGSVGHPDGAIGGRLLPWCVRSHVNFVGDSGEGQHITGQQSASDDALPVDAGAICAAEVADVDESVGFDEHAVLFGDAGVFEHEVAEFGAASDDGDGFCQSDRCLAIFGQQLSDHAVSPVLNLRRSISLKLQAPERFLSFCGFLRVFRAVIDWICRWVCGRLQELSGC